MEAQLNRRDLELIIESLEYSKMNITHGKDSPDELRQRKLNDIDTVMAKLRALRDKLSKE